jgi:hypothetical protein
LMWTPLDIPGQGSIEKQFTVRIKDTLPEGSDLLMSVSYNNEVIVSVAKSVTVTPPPPAPQPTPAVSQPPYKAPTTGPSAWFAFMLAMAFTAGVILYRTSKRISVE